MITKIINKLYEYSNCYIEIITDEKLEIPAYSFIEEDLYGRIKPMIVLNPKLFPKEENILAHILAHEWGHHALKHVFTNPKNLSSKELEAKEDEADEYASKFIKEYMYDTTPIIDFFKRHSPNFNERINILLSK